VEGNAHAALTEDEKNLFEQLKAEKRGRLEQEFVATAEVRAVLKQWRDWEARHWEAQR